jgi:hypothetical protein
MVHRPQRKSQAEACKDQNRQGWALNVRIEDPEEPDDLQAYCQEEEQQVEEEEEGAWGLSLNIYSTGQLETGQYGMGQRSISRAALAIISEISDVG